MRAVSMHRGLGEHPENGGYSWAIHLYEVRFNRNGEAYWWTTLCLDYLTGDADPVRPLPYIWEKLHAHAKAFGVPYIPELYNGSYFGLGPVELLAGLEMEYP